MKPEKAENLQDVFKSNLNEISKGRYKSEEQKESLFNDYSSIVSETKYKTIHGKGIPIMSTRVVRGRVPHVTKVSDRKVSGYSNAKIFSPKPMLQRLPIVLARVKVGNTSENLLNEIRQIIHSLHRANEITKKV